MSPLKQLRDCTGTATSKNHTQHFFARIKSVGYCGARPRSEKNIGNTSCLKSPKKRIPIIPTISTIVGAATQKSDGLSTFAAWQTPSTSSALVRHEKPPAKPNLASQPRCPAPLTNCAIGSSMTSPNSVAASTCASRLIRSMPTMTASSTEMKKLPSSCRSAVVNRTVWTLHSLTFPSIPRNAAKR